jgi:hypothetical protein
MALLLLTSSFIFLPSHFSFALSMNIDPPSIHMAMKTGDMKSGDIFITNLGSSPIKLKVYTEDWIYAPDGSKTFMKPGSTVYSCSKWIKLDTEGVTLQPKEAKKVSFNITSPKNSSGSHVSVVFFENTVDVKSGVAVSGRIGSIIYMDTEGDINKSFDAKDIIVSGSKEGSPADVLVSMENKGNTCLSIVPKVKITKDDKTVFEPTLKAINTLPGDTGYETFKTPALEAGKYKVQMELNMDDKTSKTQSEFSIEK